MSAVVVPCMLQSWSIACMF